jgi:hypothetical protein
MEDEEPITGAQSNEAHHVPTILHVGRDAGLLTIRNRVLARTGFPVEYLHDLKQIDALLHRYPRGLLVLCHSLSTAERAGVLRKLQQQPRLTGLLIAKDSTVLPSGHPEVDSIYIYQGPHALVVMATRLLSVQGSSHPSSKLAPHRQRPSDSEAIRSQP